VAALLFAWRKSSPQLLLVAGTYLGFQHFEQGTFAALILSIGVIALRGILPESLMGLRTPAWALLGVALGKILLSSYLLVAGINPTQGRAAYITDSTWTRLALKESLNDWPTLLTTLFAGAWIIVIVTFMLLKRRRDQAVLALSLILGLAVAVITLAQTRVFVMTTLALLSVMIVVVFSNSAIINSARAVLGIEIVLWVIVLQHLYISPNFGAHIMPTNALDYGIMFVQQVIQMR